MDLEVPAQAQELLLGRVEEMVVVASPREHECGSLVQELQDTIDWCSTIPKPWLSNIN